MEIDKQAILNQVRQIYLREVSMFEEYELDNDTHIIKMNGYKVDGDDLSMFIRGVQKDFDIPVVQADLEDLYTLRDFSNFVIAKLKGKSISPPIVEP